MEIKKTANLLINFLTKRLAEILGLLILVATGLISYALAALLLRAIEWREVKGLLARRQ